MNISAQYSSPAQLKKRFRQLGEKSQKEQAVVDKVELMGAGILSLDGTSLDQDENPGSVAIENKGLLAYAQASPFGGLLSVDILDERGDQPKEYSKSTEVFFSLYSTSDGDSFQSVQVNDGGFAAIAQRMESSEAAE